MSVLWRSCVILVAAVGAGVAGVDVFAVNSPWVAIVVAAITGAAICSSPVAAALCTLIATTSLEALVAWRAAEAAPGQALIHLASATLLAAAFSLTRRQPADNSATSQAQGNPEGPGSSCKEVRDED